MPTYNPGDKFVQTSDFGPRIVNGIRGTHYGVDFVAPIGTAIPAASSGVVWYSGFQSAASFGNVVVVKSVGENNQSYFTLYAHMNGQAMPAVGQQIQQGDTIGQLGNTGRGTGPHVHFEVINGSAPIRNANGGSLGVQYSQNWRM